MFFNIVVSGMPARPEESAHVTAIYGDWVALNCDVNFPDGHVVPYVVQWWRKVGYDDHISFLQKALQFFIYTRYIYKIFKCYSLF